MSPQDNELLDLASDGGVIIIQHQLFTLEFKVKVIDGMTE